VNGNWQGEWANSEYAISISKKAINNWQIGNGEMQNSITESNQKL